MEEDIEDVINRNALQLYFVQQTLDSWRFFLLFSAPPMVWVIFVASPGVARIVIALLCSFVWFGCWRLWLDKRYFSLICEENNRRAGEALFVIWRREIVLNLSFVERQQGALKQVRHTLWCIGALWSTWLIALF